MLSRRASESVHNKSRVQACRGSQNTTTLCYQNVRPRPCKNDETFCSGSTYSESFYTQCYQPTIFDLSLVHISRVISKDRFIKNCSSHLDGGYLGMYVSVTSCNLNIIKKKLLTINLRSSQQEEASIYSM